LPAKSLGELLALAKSRPGRLNFASSGTGSPNHLAGELMKMRAGVTFTHVPYKGAGPALTAVVSGNADMAFGTMVSVPPLIRAGKLRGLGVSTAHRSAAMPELPTISEAGLPGFDVASWFGIVVPAKTADSIVGVLNPAIEDVLRMPDVRERLSRQGLEPLVSTPDQFSKFLVSETTRWAAVVRQSGARVE
jgi:tripartite-type tricarboxylate transporter receptor subunit TctC